MRPSSPTSSTSPRSSSEPEETMQIFVKLLSGESMPPTPQNLPLATSLVHHSHLSPPAIPLTVPATTTISTLAQLLSLRTSIPPRDLRLAHAGKHLPATPSSTLATLSIPREATLHLTLPVRGGMPPKKIRCNFKDCKDAAQRIVGDCGFCQGHFCGKHRMLEDHRCSGLEDCKKESRERNADRLNSERTMVVKGI